MDLSPFEFSLLIKVQVAELASWCLVTRRDKSELSLQGRVANRPNQSHITRLWHPQNDSCRFSSLILRGAGVHLRATEQL